MPSHEQSPKRACMDKIATIETVVRPIKKLFVIDPDDRQGFINFIKISSGDMNGIRNLILLNDAGLFNENTVAFVRRYDPDVILNYSSRDDGDFYDCYRTRVRNNRGAGFTIHTTYQTPLGYFQNMPPGVLSMGKFLGETVDFTGEVWAVTEGPDREPTLEELLFSIHCGRVDGELIEDLKHGLFRQIIVNSIITPEQFSIPVNDHESNFLHLPAQLPSGGVSSSIFDVDYNPDQYFIDKPTVIFGAAGELSSMAYFWNMRATYPSNKTLWMPVELAESYQELIAGCEYFCSFVDDISERPPLKLLLEKLKEVDCSKYYFPVYHDWDAYKHVQNVPVVEGRLNVIHPADKIFSGITIYAMLEVRGLEETFLPASRALGELFIDERVRIDSHYVTTRINKRGLATSVSRIDFLTEEDLFIEVLIPDERAIFRTLFKDHGMLLEETRGSKVIGQVINLAGGLGNLATLLDPHVHALLVNLTPQRIGRIVREVTRELTPELSEAKLHELLARNVEHLTVIHSNKTVNAGDLLSLAGGQVADRDRFYSQVQELYEKKILLRGKSFECPSCDGKLWIPLESIREENRCYRCNQSVRLPAFVKGTPLGDSYRLNELMINAVDQGVLPVLLTLLFLDRQRFFGSRFLYDCEVRAGDNSELLAEVDVLFTLGRRLGLGEVKADRGFDLSQADRLIEVAARARADLLVFATQKGRASEEVEALRQHLTAKKLNIPAFLLPGELLFAEQQANLAKYFEAGRDNRHLAGPVLL